MSVSTLKKDPLSKSVCLTGFLLPFESAALRLYVTHANLWYILTPRNDPSLPAVSPFHGPEKALNTMGFGVNGQFLGPTSMVLGPPSVCRILGGRFIKLLPKPPPFRLKVHGPAIVTPSLRPWQIEDLCSQEGRCKVREPWVKHPMQTASVPQPEE